MYGNGYGRQAGGGCRFISSLEVMTVLQPYQAQDLRAQQIKIFIGGNKLKHPIEDEEYKFMRSVNVA